MRFIRIVTLFAVWVIVAGVGLPATSDAQDTGQTEQSDAFSREELAQMLAPIALYPDSLIAQVLMASTYPLEIVEAERWLKQNPNLKGDALSDALLEKRWDASVKMLCNFPDVLNSMSDKLDQTRKLGDAFLAQEQEVMDMIQELRRKAHEQGNLKTTKEQKVIVEREIIRLEPSEPDVIYVPVYDPVYVYGPWWYPAYPPYYWYYPRAYYGVGYYWFGPRIYIGFGLFSWCWFDWPYRHIIIDIQKSKRFHRWNKKWDSDRPRWRHDPDHRRGVAYRDRTTSRKFGIRPHRESVSTPETRGYPDKRIERQRRERDAATERRDERSRIRTDQQRQEKFRSPVIRETPFSGVGEGGIERRAIERGRSRQESGSQRPQEIKRDRGETRQQRGDSGRQGGQRKDDGRPPAGGGLRR